MRSTTDILKMGSSVARVVAIVHLYSLNLGNVIYRLASVSAHLHKILPSYLYNFILLRILKSIINIYSLLFL